MTVDVPLASFELAQANGASPALFDIAAELDRAVGALAAGCPQDALARAEAVLARCPDHAAAHRVFGQAAIFLRQSEVALASLHRSVALDPQPDSRVWLALCLEQLGRRDDALREMDAASGSLPRTAGAQFAFGLMLEKLGCHAHAVRFFVTCLALDPDHAEAHYHRGRALQVLGRNEGAVETYRQALRCDPTKAAYYSDLSGALANLGQFAEALEAVEIAVRLNPETAEGYNNLGHTLLNLNRSAEAVVAYERAVELRPGYVRAQFGRALALLKCGDFERGWPDYELRWQECQTPRTDLAMPAWQGEPLDGRTILLHAEQGFGDTLQFVRLAAQVAARGGRVVAEVPQRLVRLVGGVAGITEVVASGQPLPPADLHCPMLSLPLVLGLRLETVPAAPYLSVPRETAARAKIRGNAGHRDLVVGLVWAGDPRKGDMRSSVVDRRRSTSLSLFAPLWDVPGVSMVSFQLGDAREEIKAWEQPITDAMEGVEDFADTAARLHEVDLLISVDTAMVHLAGGLGLPVWMLSRFDGCWRWLEGRDTTPWYASMRIFRQPAPGDWVGMIEEVMGALRYVVGHRTMAA